MSVVVGKGCGSVSGGPTVRSTMRVSALLLGVYVAMSLSTTAGGVALAAPNHTHATNHTPAGNNSTTVTCFLNRFRALSPEQAKSQGISLGHKLEHKLSFGSVSFSVTMMVFGGLMLVAGWKLFKLVLSLTGFGAGSIVSFFAVSAFFNTRPSLFNCWVLSIVPVVGGLVTAAIVRKALNLAFFLLGATVGVVFGFYAYTLGLNRYEVHSGSVHWVYWACLAVPAVMCGTLSVKLESKILAFATSLVGSFAFVIGADFLILEPINPRFSSWISPSSFAHGGDGIDQNNVHLDVYTLGPIIAALVLTLLGTLLQLRLQRGKSDDDMKAMPYGGHTQGGSVHYHNHHQTSSFN